MYIEKVLARLENAAATIEAAAESLLEKKILSADDLVKKIEVVKPIEPEKPIEEGGIKPEPVDPDDEEVE